MHDDRGGKRRRLRAMQTNGESEQKDNPRIEELRNKLKKRTQSQRSAKVVDRRPPTGRGV